MSTKMSWVVKIDDQDAGTIVQQGNKYVPIALMMHEGQLCDAPEDALDTLEIATEIIIGCYRTRFPIDTSKETRQ